MIFPFFSIVFSFNYIHNLWNLFLINEIIFYFFSTFNIKYNTTQHNTITTAYNVKTIENSALSD